MQSHPSTSSLAKENPSTSLPPVVPPAKVISRTQPAEETPAPFAASSLPPFPAGSSMEEPTGQQMVTVDTLVTLLSSSQLPQLPIPPSAPSPKVKYGQGGGGSSY